MVFDLQQFKLRPSMENRHSFLFLRWLVIIMASYLTLFSHLRSLRFSAIVGFIASYVLSNVLVAMVAPDRFSDRWVQRAILGADAFFGSACLYLLRVEATPFYLAFIGVYLLALIYRDVRLVLFSLFAVSVLYVVFSNFALFGFGAEVNLERFLQLALFFVVSIFYVFLADRFHKDAELSRSLIEESRNAEVMLEITRALSSSLRTEEVLFVIVSKLRAVFDATECLIARVERDGISGTILATSGQKELEDTRLDAAAYGGVLEAARTRTTVNDPVAGAGRETILAMPMVIQEALLGVIALRIGRPGFVLSGRNLQFFEVVVSAAANALRNAQLFAEVEHLARTDFLTGLPNHRTFQSTLTQELDRAQRHDHTFSMLMIDLDYLKVVNDRFGHPMGDIVIRTIAERILSTCRGIDFAARYGGEEFSVILPETPLAGAVLVAERVRERIASCEFPGLGHITASIGVANYPANALTKEDLIRVADQALYAAKNSGRNRVAHFDFQLASPS